MRSYVSLALTAIALLCAMHSSAYAQLAQPVPSIDEEVALWEHIKMSAIAADYEDYLRRYPNGRFAATATQRLRAILRATHGPTIIIDERPVSKPHPTRQHPNEWSKPSTPRPNQF
jgi:hypothetical protein